MDNTLEKLSAVYQQYAMRSPKFTQVLVNSPLFHTMNSNISKIRQLLNSNLMHTNISLLDYELRNIFYSYGTSIIPLKDMHTIEHFTYLTETITEEFRPFLKDSLLLDEFTMLFAKCYKHYEHPFDVALKQIISYSSNNYIIVTKRMLLPNLVKRIHALFPDFSLEFIAYTDFLKKTQAYDNVLFIGSPKIYNETILQHINANHFYFILFSCYYTELKIEPWIEHDRIITNFDTPTIHQKEITYSLMTLDVEKLRVNDSTFELAEPIIPESLINSILTIGPTNKEDKMKECKLVELENSQFLFEEIGAKAKCDIITTDFLYKRKHLNDVETNEFIILIDFYKWEDRKKLADTHFEKSGILEDRKIVANLKNYLTKQIGKYGIEKYTTTLNRKLNINLKKYQLVGLTKKESFQLRDEQLFLKLLEYFTKNPATASKYFKACTNLNRYHNRVGHIARRKLRNYLNENPTILEAIEEISKIQIPGMEFLKVELYQIKRISTQTYNVPLSRRGILLDLYDEEVI